MITKTRRIQLTQITSGAVSTIPPITKIAVGSGGIDETGEPKETSETQTTLFEEIARFDIEEVVYPIETTARYTIIIGETQLIGASISEIGLLNADGELCAIKTMYEKKKDDLVQFTFEFDDEF